MSLLSAGLFVSGLMDTLYPLTSGPSRADWRRAIAGFFGARQAINSCCATIGLAKASGIAVDYERCSYCPM
jgi:hypothetical protein